MIWKTALAASAILVAPAAVAQDTYHWPAPEVSADAQQKFYFPQGTPVMLRTLTQVSTKDNKPGDRVYLEVAEDVTFRGQVVIPEGSPVVGEVSRVQRNGHFGRKGKLEIRLIRVQTPWGPVRLSGAEYDEGKSGTAASVATMLLVSPLGFIIKGTSGYIAPNTPVTARLGEDMDFRYAPTVRTAVNTQQAVPDVANVRPGFSMLED